MTYLEKCRPPYFGFRHFKTLGKRNIIGYAIIGLMMMFSLVLSAEDKTIYNFKQPEKNTNWEKTQSLTATSENGKLLLKGNGWDSRYYLGLWLEPGRYRLTASAKVLKLEKGNFMVRIGPDINLAKQKPFCDLAFGTNEGTNKSGEFSIDKRTHVFLMLHIESPGEGIVSVENIDLIKINEPHTTVYSFKQPGANTNWGKTQSLTATNENGKLILKGNGWDSRYYLELSLSPGRYRLSASAKVLKMEKGNFIVRIGSDLNLTKQKPFCDLAYNSNEAADKSDDFTIDKKTNVYLMLHIESPGEGIVSVEDLELIRINETEQNTAAIQFKTLYRGFTATIDAGNDSISPEDLRDMKKDWHANIVRFIMLESAVEDFMKDIEAGKKPKIVAWLDQAKELGILPVIDLHTVPWKQPKVDFFAAEWNKKQLNEDQKNKYLADLFWQDRNNLQYMIRFWHGMAKICKDRQEEIWFDLYNEPVCWKDLPSYPSAWPEWAQTLIDTIRAVDSKHAIMIEPGPGGLSWGFKNFPALKGDNLIYSPHQYEPHGYTHQGLEQVINQKEITNKLRGWPGEYPENNGKWDKKRLEELFAPIVAFQQKNKVRIFVGEFGVCKWNPDAGAYLKDNIDLFEKYGWDWTIHIFRSSQPAFEIEASEKPVYDGKLQNALIKPPQFTERGKLVESYLRRNLDVKQ